MRVQQQAESKSVGGLEWRPHQSTGWQSDKRDEAGTQVKQTNQTANNRGWKQTKGSSRAGLCNISQLDTLFDSYKSHPASNSKAQEKRPAWWVHGGGCTVVVCMVVRGGGGGVHGGA